MSTIVKKLFLLMLVSCFVVTYNNALGDELESCMDGCEEGKRVTYMDDCLDKTNGSRIECYNSADGRVESCKTRCDRLANYKETVRRNNNENTRAWVIGWVAAFIAIFAIVFGAGPVACLNRYRPIPRQVAGA